MYDVAYGLYRNHYKRQVDSIPLNTQQFIDNMLDEFQDDIWYNVLNIVEFLRIYCLEQEGIPQQNFEREINEILEREKSAYRFISGKLASITNEIEIQELEQAARHGDRFAPVAEHVRTALELYSKKPQPDYRNSIKESISAVESAVKIITGQPKATLAARRT